jgi:hypothetical protein
MGQVFTSKNKLVILTSLPNRPQLIHEAAKSERRIKSKRVVYPT